MKRNFWLALFLVPIISWVGCGHAERRTETEKKIETAEKAALPTADSLVIELEGETGKSVFEITKVSHRVDFIESPGGVFVKGIDFLTASNSYAWIYSVNDSTAPVSSERFLTKNGDRIKWHFRKLQ